MIDGLGNILTPWILHPTKIGVFMKKTVRIPVSSELR